MTQVTGTTLPMPASLSDVTAHLIADHDWPARTPLNSEHAQAHNYAHGIGRPDLADTGLTHVHRAAHSGPGFIPTHVAYTIPGKVQTKKIVRNQSALDFQRRFCEQRGLELFQQPMTDAEFSADRKARRIGGGIVVTIVAVVMIMMATSSGSGSTDGSGHSPAMAFEMCKGFVKNQLKAPSTATFRNFYQEDGEVRVAGSGAGPYTVRSTVDSQNGFGAEIRSNFTCTVTATGDTWRASSVLVY